ncbi:MAG: rod shape-determining protein RodA [bacterium]
MALREKALATADRPLLIAIIMLCSVSVLALYSASGEDPALLARHGMRAGIAIVLMLLVARIPPSVLAHWSPYVYGFGMLLLVVVLAVGVVGKGAQRWLDLYLLRFQPAEMMKLAVPMMIAWLLTRVSLPPRAAISALAALAALVPAALVMLQPDLGTAILILLAGIIVIFLAGLGWKSIAAVLTAVLAATPALWTFVLHDYQRRRIVTLLDPWADPLGAGYHTIQSIIAVGSGGFEGKGWLASTQARLDFIPERATDFVFAVYAEEFGFIGAVALLLLYLFATCRGLMISFYAHDTYSRLLGGCLSLLFFLHAFVNIGMAIGLLPVVGVPLPLISYGGTSMVTLMIAFGILMSIHRNRKILPRHGQHAI